jgi:hypothetical protein
MKQINIISQNKKVLTKKHFYTCNYKKGALDTLSFQHLLVCLDNALRYSSPRDPIRAHISQKLLFFDSRKPHTLVR